MKMKRLAGLALTLCLGFSLFSCGGAPQHKEDGDDVSAYEERELPVVYAGSALPISASTTALPVTGSVWYTENNFENPVIEATATHTAAGSTLALKADGYSLIRIVSNIGEVKSNYYYDIKVDVKKNLDTTDVDVLEIYYNASGSELLRQYVNDGTPSLSPDGTARLDVYVLVRGWDSDTVTVGLPKVTELAHYEKREVKLAAVTLENNKPDSMWDNINQALEKVDELCADPNGKPDLILFTERFHTMNLSFSKLRDSYIRIDSDYIKAMQAKAREHGIYISFSFREIDGDGNCYNSSPLIDRQGNIVANYHKTHLTMGELARGIVPGDEFVVYDTDFGRVGFAICWDLFFNNCADSLAKMGVELVINPSLGYWDDINSMRAEDTGMYILTAGQANSGTSIIRPEDNDEGSPSTAGKNGNIIDRGDWGRNDGIVTATIDLAERFPIKYLSAPYAATRPNVYQNEARPDLYEKYK